ncbi:MAG: rhodanese-like domain-containing protein [Acidimicrobiales bacterium]
MTQAGPTSFETLLSNPAAVLINVHVPYEGEIAGTTRFIAFDTIASDPGLPRGKATPILLYCETGNMSSIAAAALTNAGYTNVTELTGGMQAWQASGRTIVAR